MKRRLLILALGVAFLVLVTGLGTFATNFIPATRTPQTQSSQTGPYLITLRVDPNPPTSNQLTTLSLQIQQSATHQPLDGAHVTVEGTMEEMGMGTSALIAREQSAGLYVAHVPLSMGGSWQVQVSIALAGQPTFQTVFTVSAQ